jgi:hypothetical protein
VAAEDLHALARDVLQCLGSEQLGHRHFLAARQAARGQVGGGTSQIQRTIIAQEMRI